MRTRPARGQVERAEAIHQRFRDGRADGLANRRGAIVRTAWWARRLDLRTLPLGWRQPEVEMRSRSRSTGISRPRWRGWRTWNATASSNSRRNGSA
jgi:hypothetical protein